MPPTEDAKFQKILAKIPARPEEPNRQPHPDVVAARKQDVWIFFTILRCSNAVFINTFFQPDEFYQALEPAWQMAFGKDSGVWITWEWTYHLRSSLHPAFFAGVYKLTAFVSGLIQFPPTLSTLLLTLSPAMAQAAVAACMDYFTWELGIMIYGFGSAETWAILALTATSPWQGFASVRTFSNSFESTLTIAALTFWPWQWYKPSSGSRVSTQVIKKSGSKAITWREVLMLIVSFSIRFCFTLAALACVLRPTNLLIWIPLSILTMSRVYHQQLTVAVREMILCGSGVLAASILADRAYYGVWTFPPYNFLYFNLTQDLAVFYGKNRVDYYFSEGMGLLLTTAAPFALVGVINALLGRRPPKQEEMQSSTAVSPFAMSMKRDLAIVALIVPCVMSFISHKEVRFIYPILPILFVLAGPPTASFFRPAAGETLIAHVKKIILGVIILGNAFLILYGIIHHQRGVMDVTSFLRDEFELNHLKIVDGNVTIGKGVEPMPMTVGFLMPCHSTPWRSRLIYEGIEAWALTCEPPVDMAPEARAVYVDEADQFYADPPAWIKTNLGSPPKGLLKNPYSGDKSLIGLNGKPGKREWPQKLVHFQQLDEVMDEVLKGTKYEICSRLFNTGWHEDWRRKGGIVVRCLDVEGR